MMLLQKKRIRSVQRLHHANLSWDLDEASCTNSTTSSSSSSEQFYPQSTTKSAQPLQQHPSLNHKRVQFDLARNEYYDTTTDHARPQQTSLWYRGAELRAFRSEVAALGRHANHSNRSSSSSLGSYRREESSAPSSSNIFVVVRDLYQDCQRNNNSDNHQNSRLPSSLEDSYLTLLANQPELMGVERFVLDAVMTKQHKSRRRLQLLQAANRPPASKYVNKADKKHPLSIHQSCEDITAASRGFAIRVGQLHTKAVLAALVEQETARE